MDLFNVVMLMLCMIPTFNGLVTSNKPEHSLGSSCDYVLASPFRNVLVDVCVKRQLNCFYVAFRVKIYIHFRFSLCFRTLMVSDFR